MSAYIVLFHWDEVFLVAALFKWCTAIALIKYSLLSSADLHLLENAHWTFINKKVCMGTRDKSGMSSMHPFFHSHLSRSIYLGFIIKNMYIFIFLSNAVFPNKGQFIWTCPWGQNKALEVRQSSKFYSNPGSPIPLAVFVTYTFFFFARWYTAS